MSLFARWWTPYRFRFTARCVAAGLRVPTVTWTARARQHWPRARTAGRSRAARTRPSPRLRASAPRTTWARSGLLSPPRTTRTSWSPRATSTCRPLADTFFTSPAPSRTTSLPSWRGTLLATPYPPAASRNSSPETPVPATTSMWKSWSTTARSASATFCPPRRRLPGSWTLSVP